MINPSHVECDDIIEWLDDYRRHKLEPHLRVIVSEHLAQCDHCTEELRLRDALAVHFTSSVADQPAAPADLSPRVRAAIAAMNPTAQAGKKPQMLPWMLTGAAAVLIAVAAFQTQLFDSSAPSTDLASAPAETKEQLLRAHAFAERESAVLMEAAPEAATYSRRMPAQDAAVMADAPAPQPATMASAPASTMPPPSASPAPAAAQVDSPPPPQPVQRQLTGPARTGTTASLAGTTTATADQTTTRPQQAPTTATATGTTAPPTTASPPQP